MDTVAANVEAGSPAARMRRRLAAARARGASFEAAWSESFLPAVRTAAADRRAWRTALEWSEPEWKAAYRGEPASPGVVAVLELLEQFDDT